MGSLHQGHTLASGQSAPPAPVTNQSHNIATTIATTLAIIQGVQERLGSLSNGSATGSKGTTDICNMDQSDRFDTDIDDLTYPGVWSSFRD